MRFWQHLCIGSFFVYLLGCLGMAFLGMPDKEGPVGTVLLVAVIALPFALGPLAFVALIMDIRARFTDPGQRLKWTLLCLLVPGALYYWM
eukprot:gene48454-59337_t